MSERLLISAVAGGLGISVVSQHTLSLPSLLEGLVVLKVASFPLARHWYIVYPKGKSLSVVTETFLQFLKNNVYLIKK